MPSNRSDFKFKDSKNVYQTDQPFIKTIVVKHIEDDNPQLEYLTQEYTDVTEEENEKYKQQDKERLDNYQITWHSIGIRADTTVYVPHKGTTSARLVHLTSGGIWGIDIDFNGNNEDEYIKETEESEIEDLKDLLKKFNINYDNVEIVREDE